jgi:hypothetical protein
MGLPAGRIVDTEVLAERARNLAARNLNGIRRVTVRLLPDPSPTEAWLDLEFHEALHLPAILAAIGGGAAPSSIFPIAGGVRITAGNAIGQVRVTQVLAGLVPTQLRLKVPVIGDYSTYLLSVDFAGIDPLLSEIPFKFRPACFNLDCAEGERIPASPALPDIDYLAKDYDSFKHVLSCAMQSRVPGWVPTSEADLDQVLIDLLAADADELSDLQDRTFNEAYLATARKRVSLARHARLMDYHIHEGQQAHCLLAIETGADARLPAGTGAWTGGDWKHAGSRIFISARDVQLRRVLNTLSLYSWGGSVTALDAGATTADIALPPGLNPASAVDANTLAGLLNAPRRALLLQQHINPHTGTPNGRDIRARQHLRLLGDAAPVFDPMAGAAGEWCVRVHWEDADALLRRYCFITHCDSAPPNDRVSLFHGNVVGIVHGRPHRTTFRPPGAPLGAGNPNAFVRTDEAHYAPTRRGVVCVLPNAPLAYRETPADGIAATRSTLDVRVSGFANPWEEQSDLVESTQAREHYVVETDERRISRVRFGHGENGRALPDGAVVTCWYQVGDGIDGNVGSDAIVGFNPAALPPGSRIWNPFDAIGGRAPEPVADVLRRVPEAYRARQLRAITLGDYVRRAEALEGVAHAHAAYAWTGSWRTVRVAIDPRGRTVLDPTLRARIADWLDAVRLIGEDLEVRPARYVPLDIRVRVCAHPDYWPEHLRNALESEFSDGYTLDGRRGFFHPDEWTFGQALHVSQLIGRALSVPGVGRVLRVSIRRLHGLSGPSLSTVVVEEPAQPVLEHLAVRPDEIVQVANDPSRLETGRIAFEILGGRR